MPKITFIEASDCATCHCDVDQRLMAVPARASAAMEGGSVTLPETQE